MQRNNKTANKKYRILMIAPIFAPFGNPEAIVNNKLALAFLNAGYHIDVISRKQPEMYGYNYGSSWDEPWLPLKDITHEVTYDVGGKIRRFIETARDALRMRHPIVGCRWAAHAFDLALHLHKQNHYQIILSRSLPDVGHLPALAMAKVVDLPWIANWNDASGVKNLPPAGEGPHGKLGFFHERFLNKVAQKASWHTFPSDRMRLHICQYLGYGTEGKSSTIPHVAIKPSKARKWKKNEMFKICLAGKFYAGRNPNIFFQGLTQFLKGRGLQTIVKLIIIGLDDIGLSKLLGKYRLESNVQITGPQSYKDTLRYLRKSDVLLVIEAPYENGIYLPSKFIDYVQVGRPILAVSPKNGTLHDIISTHGGGIAVDCTSSETIAHALNKLYSQWRKNTIDDIYNSYRLYHLFSPKTIIESYRKIFKYLGVTSF